MTPRERADEVDIVFTDRLHVKAHLHDTATRNNIAAAIAEAVAQERERCAAIASHSGLPELAIAIRNNP
jgi:hypothetical protein